MIIRVVKYHTGQIRVIYASGRTLNIKPKQKIPHTVVLFMANMPAKIDNISGAVVFGKPF